MLFYEDKVPQSKNTTCGIYFSEYKILEAIQCEKANEIPELNLQLRKISKRADEAEKRVII